MSILPQPRAVRRLLRRLLDAALPGSCLLCGDGSATPLLCATCADDLPPLPAALCPRCGEQTTHGERCGACLKETPHFDRTLALFRYDFPLDRLVHALKYGHQLAVADWLGHLMAERLSGQAPELIIPLPLHADRLRERGFNQSGEIARRLGRQLGRTVAHDSLFRSRATPPQAELAWRERQRNVRGAFECRDDLSGRHLLLVDDVMTTGATVNEAARVLKLHGAASVTVIVAARAFKH